MGFRLCAALRGERENLLVSPHGVWSALALLYPGAAGTTREQLTDLLGIDDLAPVIARTRALAGREVLSDWHRALVRGHLTQTLDPEALRLRLALANALWIQDGYALNADYVAAVTEALDAPPAHVDFAGDPSAACARVNAWAAEATAGRIPTVLSPLSISQNTRVVLANAIYFKARWQHTFSPGATRSEPFHKLDGAIDVPMMHRVGHYAYAADPLVELIELPYINDDVVMDVIVPRPGQFAAVEAQLSVPRYFALLGAVQPNAWVKLSLPRFRVDTDVSLRAALSAMGLGDVFNAERADFSALSDEPGFHLDDVLHRTFVATDELGTEAAAVTMPMMAGAGLPPEPIELRVDRPFYFAIRDKPENAILFLGRVLDPTQVSA